MSAKKWPKTVLVALLCGIWSFIPLLRGMAVAATNQFSPARLLTYNTALMTLSATVYTTNVPLGFTISIDTNGSKFGGQSYDDRVTLMAQYIKQDDPDVVVLNEVWDDDYKEAFVDELALKGPYKFYVKKIVGQHPGFANPFAVGDPATVLDLAAHELGTPAGSALLTFFSALAAPFLPPVLVTGPVTSIDLGFQDSGIMLFSKKPFVPFDSATFVKDPSVVVIGYNGPNKSFWGSGNKEVAAVVYNGARGMDQLASKAVGLVRIQQTPNSIINVAFSHTNADENGPEENADVRAYQMAAVKQMMLTALTPDELAHQQLYMLGDLNTPGKNKKIGTTEEWSTLFGLNAPNSPYPVNPGVFFACGDTSCNASSGAQFNAQGSFLTEAWGFETSVADRHVTNYFDGQYYDYVLHNKPNTPAAPGAPVAHTCMQHIRIGAEMVDDVSNSQLSDHLPVHVDFNLAAPQCTPNDNDAFGPKVLKLTSKTPVQTFTKTEGATLTYPGSMQWYKIPKAGTYWIKLTDTTHVTFDIYQDDDLSTPIKPYHGETDPEKGQRFVTAKPLYIRVYAKKPDGTPDRTWTGAYGIRFQKALGVTPDDAIGLLPAVRNPYDWVSSGIDQPKVWFDFYTNQTFNGTFADSTIINETSESGVTVDKTLLKNQLFVQVGANKYQLSSYVEISLLKANPKGFANYKNPVLGSVTGFKVEMPQLQGQAKSGGGTGLKKYYYLLTRDPSFGQLPQNLRSSLTFLTNLQYLRPISISAKSPLYGSPEQAGIGFNFDNSTPGWCGIVPNIGCTWIETHSSSPAPLPLSAMLQGPFKKEALPTVWVQSMPLLGSAETAQIGHAYNGSQVHAISIPREKDGDPKCQVILDNDAAITTPNACPFMVLSQPYGDSYDYWLFYTITHEPQP